MTKFLLSIFIIGLVVQSLALPRPLKVGHGRIVGGAPTIPGELPFQVRLRYVGTPICGASILSRDIILTAAHCAEVGGPETLSIVAGDWNRNVDEGTEQVRSVSRVVIHEDYNGDTFANDIALLFLSEPLDINDHVRPVPVPPAGHLAQGNGIASGWGSTSEGGNAADILQKVTVPIITDDNCRASYGNLVLDSMICAGYPAGGQDTCEGDSGGPLTATDIGVRYLVGIISWGSGCARPGFPTVYTEVSHFIEWIHANV